MSFFSEVEAFFKKVFGSNKWEQSAAMALTLTEPLIETAVQLIAGEAAGKEAQIIMDRIKSGLAVAAKLIGDVQAGTASSSSTVGELKGVLGAVQGDLQTLLSAGQIKNPATLAKVTIVTNSVVNEIQAVLDVLPAGV